MHTHIRIHTGTHTVHTPCQPATLTHTHTHVHMSGAGKPRHQLAYAERRTNGNSHRVTHDHRAHQ